MPTPVSRVAGRGERANAAVDPAPRHADVVAVHRTREDPIRVAVEAVDELVALVVEVADDRRAGRRARRARPNRSSKSASQR